MNDQKTCEKHGEVSTWIVCKHVAEGSAETIIFSENEDALCFDCANIFENLTEDNMAEMCLECLKDFTAKLMINATTFANLQNRLVGVEHLKGSKRKKPTS